MTSRSLADIAAHLDLLEVRCSRCDRHGVLSIARLIDQHGAATKLPDLRQHFVGDCEKADSPEFERCDIYFPQLRAFASQG